ncbi:MAG: bifunctional 4-hydroxy-2-oxoglutarate aldolase/2-dehydro-3-deoxy-phosphogluconate aldolase [Anaerolineae bacterium]
MDKQTIVQRMTDCGITAVFRTDDTEGLIPAAAAFCAGGVPIIEFTLTMPGALGLIEKGRAELPEGAILGAGTVLDAAAARVAILAGAQFVVSPVLDAEVVDVCNRYGVPMIPGAMTPTEIMQALRLGVDMVKLFPACSIGSRGLAELLGPFPGLRIVAAAVGGTAYVGEYIASGAAVVCVGGAVVDALAYAKRDRVAIQAAAAGLAETVQTARRAQRVAI